jgi:hypothetical protein
MYLHMYLGDWNYRTTNLVVRQFQVGRARAFYYIRPNPGVGVIGLVWARPENMINMYSVQRVLSDVESQGFTLHSVVNYIQ